MTEIITITSKELAQFRKDVSNLLPDTCNILTVIRTSDNAGGWSTNDGTAGTAIACRLDFPEPGKEGPSGTSLVPYKSAILSLAWDVSISTDNQVYIGGHTYNVTGENRDQSWIGVKRVLLERVP